jgi:Uma2 family endonuclease
MKLVEIDKKFASDEEYFLFEEKSELKHELINKNLYEISGVSKEHNEISGNIFILLKSVLKKREWEIFFEAFKIRTPNGNYFYPDVCVSFPDVKKYFTDQPILIVEVLSETTRSFDLTDKFIQYRKIETLEYYLCVEPEQQVVIFNFKNEQQWMTETFTKDESVINLPKLNISFSVKELYQGSSN